MLFLLSLLRRNIAARAKHAHDLAIGAVLDRPAAVFDPAPMPLAVAHPVLDPVILAAPFEVLDQCAAQQR
ncbi:hypothetical protein D3C84_933600 [compost metagenome]